MLNTFIRNARRITALVLTLVLVLGCSVGTAFAAPAGGISVTFRTAIYSITNESFVRWPTELASMDECGSDEFLTVAVTVKNQKSVPLTIQAPGISIDGGEIFQLAATSLKAGEECDFHVFSVHRDCMTPGLHTAKLYDGERELASGRFSIGRAWSGIFSFPAQEQIESRSGNGRSPYVAGWMDTGGTRFDMYSVDFKSDYMPNGTYSCPFNGYLDFSVLDGQYTSVDNDGSISLYGGLQTRDDGTTNSILSFWDIYCTNKDGTQTVIRPERIYPSGTTGQDSFTGEGEGAHTMLPYEWKAGRWYRMLLQCGTNEKTGNTTVAQWFKDLVTGEWTHTCTYDIGLKTGGFTGDVAFFSENWGDQFAGEVRSLELANVRIHTGNGWKDVTRIKNGITEQFHLTGSWEAGTDGNTIYMISTGVPGWGRTKSTGEILVRNRETGSPLYNDYPAETVHFADVAPGAWYADAVAWAVRNGITSGTSETTFSPNQDCTQAQILTFLWRAMGSPKPSGAVGDSQYYASAVQWAREQGILGESFSADAPCTRAMAVTYLWKLAGSPAQNDSAFRDVPAGAVYADAASWAVQEGITAGTGPGMFSPDAICSRGQIVTFLFLALG